MARRTLSGRSALVMFLLIAFLDRVKAFFTDLLAKLKQFDLNVQLFLIKIMSFLGIVPMLGGFEM